MNKKLSIDEIKKIQELRGLGFSAESIGKKIGCASSTVLYHTSDDYKQKMNAPHKRGHGKRLDDDLKNQIVEMIKLGYSNRKISRTIGVHYATVGKYKNPEIRENAKQKSKKYRKQHISVLLKKERGSRCQICGFDKHDKCLDFHHKIPKDKKFGIAQAHRDPIANTDQKIREEAAKCILVCKNCHALIHAGVIQIPLDLN
jgi:hypothetical protein